MNGISYITTIYNKKPFLAATIKGLRAQIDGYPKEFIFVDDGSTDGSMELVKRQTKDWPNTKYINQANAGPSTASNAGAAAAQYEWLKFVDGDDVLTPWIGKLMLDKALEAQVDILYAFDPEKTYKPNLYPENILKLEQPKNVKAEIFENNIRLVFRYGLYGMSNVIVRRNAYLDVGGCDSKVFVQEHSLSLRLYNNYRTATVNVISHAYPAVAEGRVSGNIGQLLYDQTLAQNNFMLENAQVALADRQYALRRAIGRGWKWAHRECGKSVFSKIFLFYILAQMRVPLPERYVFRIALDAFEDTKNIRRLGPKR